MHIRKMSIDDYDEVHNLWLNTPGMGLNDIDDSIDGINKFLLRNPNTCFVAEKDNEIIGVVLSGHDGRRGTIYHAAVSLKHQRNGIGKKLLDTAMDALKDEGVTKVFLVVYEENEKGNAFWEKESFKKRVDLVYRDKLIVKLKSYK